MEISWNFVSLKKWEPWTREPIPTNGTLIACHSSPAIG